MKRGAGPKSSPTLDEYFVFFMKAFFLPWRGLSLLNFKSGNLYWGVSLWFSLSVALVVPDYTYIKIFLWAFDGPLVRSFLRWVYQWGMLANIAFVFFIPLVGILFVLGAFQVIVHKRLQRAIELAGPKGAPGASPQVRKRIRVDRIHSILRVSSPGMGPGKWERQREDLSFELRQDITKIVPSSDRRFIDIHLSKRPLPKKVDYFDCVDALTTPYSFIVGESESGIITQSIRELPHMLMGGATGMGKSTAFKLCIYSLLRSSPPEGLKMVLLDLKKGVEVADFQEFPQVTIAKNEEEAVRALEKIVQEMQDRYLYLEKEKYKKIEPLRDKLPIIVLGVDEASVLYGTQNSNPSKKELINRARDLTSQIAKLGRASGIHLILATQRAIKSSIDMATQDNLEGRLCFRTKSVSGSTAVLGNNDASSLPDIPGRAIWSKGSKVQLVQVPFLKDEVLSEECEALAEKFQEAIKKHQGSPSKGPSSRKMAFKKSTGIDS